MDYLHHKLSLTSHGSTTNLPQTIVTSKSSTSSSSSTSNSLILKTINKENPTKKISIQQNDYLHPKYSLPLIKVDLANQLVTIFILLNKSNFKEYQNNLK